MRKKIEELRNREEGFTLVELLAVIVILGIIVAIAIPAVGSVTDRARSGAKEAEASLVEDAARLYITTGEEELGWSSGDATGEEKATINVVDLIEKGYLESDVEPSTENGTVTVTRERTNAAPETETETSAIYTYEYEFEPKPEPEPANIG